MDFAITDSRTEFYRRLRPETNTVWFIDYNIRKAFDDVKRSRLKNLFLKHVNNEHL